jgi:prepilin-type N-terminal cleavage/methylation domain-containing protein
MRKVRSSPSQICVNPHRTVGFTLLELLIAVSIMLILLAITASALRVNNEGDRIRGGARQIQSYLLGARDRAIYAKSPRGVRFILDEGNRRTVKSMVYVENTDPWRGQVELLPLDTTLAWNSTTNPLRRLRLRDVNTAPNWRDLFNRGLLKPGLRVRIPASNRGQWYVMQDFATAPSTWAIGFVPDLILTTEYRTPNPNAAGINFEQAEIELPPSVVANAEPVALPRNVVVDLTQSRGPAAWLQGTQFTNQMDLLFSPRGVVVGPAAAIGVLHLYVTDQAAADLGLNPGFGANLAAPLPVNATAETPIPDKTLVTVFTRTGSVIASPVNTTDVLLNASGTAGADGLADDPYLFAERGEIAGK